MATALLRDSGRRRPVRVILIGDRRVGKTSILRFLINGTFSEERTQTVDGHDEATVEYRSGAKASSLCVADTAGRNSEYTLSESYYRNASAAVLVFSEADVASLRRLKTDGYQAVRDRLPDALVFLFGNKADLKREVSPESVAGFADSYDIPKTHRFSMSCRTGRGVREAFDTMSQILLKRSMDSLESPESEQSTKVVTLHYKEKSSSSSCSC